MILTTFLVASSILTSCGGNSEKKVEVEETEEEVIIKKPKPKPKPKKIVYVEESESEEEEEEVIVKKKTKAKPQPLEHLVYNNTKDQLYNRMIEERVKASIIGYGNSLGV